MSNKLHEWNREKQCCKICALRYNTIYVRHGTFSNCQNVLKSRLISFKANHSYLIRVNDEK